MSEILNIPCEEHEVPLAECGCVVGEEDASTLVSFIESQETLDQEISAAYSLLGAGVFGYYMQTNNELDVSMDMEDGEITATDEVSQQITLDALALDTDLAVYQADELEVQGWYDFSQQEADLVQEQFQADYENIEQHPSILSPSQELATYSLMEEQQYDSPDGSYGFDIPTLDNATQPNWELDSPEAETGTHIDDLGFHVDSIPPSPEEL